MTEPREVEAKFSIDRADRERLVAVEQVGRFAVAGRVAATQTDIYFDTPCGDLGLAELLAASGVTVWHAGLYRDETGALAAMHLPLSHDLEAWGDVQASDGTVTIRQPLIDPLHGSLSRTELLAWLASGQAIDGYSLLKGQWMQVAGEIHLGTRSILEYLLSPVQKAFHEAGRER